MRLAADGRRCACRTQTWTQILKILLVCLSLGGSAAETLDRIAVTIGKHVIAESEVIRDLRVTAFLDQKPVDLSPAAKRKSADRLVDQFLILQDATLSHLTLPTPADAAALLEDLKGQYGTGYTASLARDFITEADVAEHLLQGLRALRFSELRFRPEIQLSEDELREFYGTLVTGWKREGRSPIPTFEESRETVEKMMVDQRTLQSLDRWLGAERTDNTILYRDAVFKDVSKGDSK